MHAYDILLNYIMVYYILLCYIIWFIYICKRIFIYICMMYKRTYRLPQEHKTGASSETPYCHCKGSSQDWRYVFRSLQLDERLQPHQLITTIFCFRSSLAAIAQCYLIKDMFVLSSSYTSHQPGFNRACNRRTADS